MPDGRHGCRVQAFDGAAIGMVAACCLHLPWPGDQGAAAPGGGMVRIAGVPPSAVVNERSGPGTANRMGDTPRRPGVRHVGSALWWEAETVTGLRGLGRANAGYPRSSRGARRCACHHAPVPAESRSRDSRIANRFSFGRSAALLQRGKTTGQKPIRVSLQRAVGSLRCTCRGRPLSAGSVENHAFAAAGTGAGRRHERT